MEIRVKRVYDAPAAEDGFRVLVDGVWPRGLTKEEAHIDLWLREAAPSTALRQWFSHDPERWTEFRDRYFQELDQHPEVVRRLLSYATQGVLTLLFSARNREHNQAVALREYLLQRIRR
jgi:uncharacterized protein YeaO (DUF488 family)